MDDGVVAPGCRNIARLRFGQRLHTSGRCEAGGAGACGRNAMWYWRLSRFSGNGDQTVINSRRPAAGCLSGFAAGSLGFLFETIGGLFEATGFLGLGLLGLLTFFFLFL